MSGPEDYCIQASYSVGVEFGEEQLSIHTVSKGGKPVTLTEEEFLQLADRINTGVGVKHVTEA